MTVPTATITGPITYPQTSRALGNRTVTVECVGPAGAVLRTSDGGLVGSSTVHTDTAGDFSIVLATNADIDEASGVGPPGTYWRFTVGTRPAVSWLIRLEASDADTTILIGSGPPWRIVDPTPRGWVPLQGAPGPKGDPGDPGDPGPKGDKGDRGPGRAIIADTSTSVARWEQRLINTLAAGDENYSTSVGSDGALEITAPASNTDGNNRMAMCLPEAHTDVEMHALIQPPSPQTITAKIPQVGMVLRVQDHDDGTTSAFVVDTNISANAYTQVWLALWQWPTAVDRSAPAIDATSIFMREQQPRILSALRANVGIWLDQFVVDRVPAGWHAAKPTVKVDADDDQFDQASVQIISADRDGTITVPAPAGADAAIPITPAAGTIRIPPPSPSIAPLSYYPLHVVARVVGTVAEMRIWPDADPDPGWGNPQASLRHDFADSTLHVPTAGQVGLLANHLQAGKSIRYSDITITDLDTGR